MQYYLRLALLAAFWAIVDTAAVADDRPNAVFYAGAATADLTPEAGVSLDGPISKPGPARGTHDRLTSRALALRLGQTRVLIVVNDMCMIDREVYDAAKQRIADQSGIPVSHQLMAATHSHATPRVVRISTGPRDEAYRLLVVKRITDAAVRAVDNLAPAKIAFTSFDKTGLAACRRFLCEEGSVAPNPFGETGERVQSVAGKSSRVIRPAGAVDPEFSLLSLQHVDGRPMAVLGNFGVHYAGGYETGQVSADYFGVYARRIEAVLASKAAPTQPVGIMSNGASGDIGSFQRREKWREPWTLMDHFGNLLADETVKALDKLVHVAPESMEVVVSELALRVRKPDARRLEWARSLLAGPENSGIHRWSRIYANETLQLSRFPDHVTIPLQAMRIGEIAIAAAPCEVFAETGLAIKQASPLSNTFVMELANGYSGYLPTQQQHQWGGYETWPARSSHLEITAEQKIRAELIRLLQAVSRRR